MLKEKKKQFNYSLFASLTNGDNYLKNTFVFEGTTSVTKKTDEIA